MSYDTRLHWDCAYPAARAAHRVTPGAWCGRTCVFALACLAAWLSDFASELDRTAHGPELACSSDRKIISSRETNTNFSYFLLWSFASDGRGNAWDAGFCSPACCHLHPPHPARPPHPPHPRLKWTLKHVFDCYYYYFTTRWLLHLQFVDHYSKTKTQADKRILAANGTLTANGSVLRCCVLRLAGVYGPGEQRHFPRIVVSTWTMRTHLVSRWTRYPAGH